MKHTFVKTLQNVLKTKTLNVMKNLGVTIFISISLQTVLS